MNTFDFWIIKAHCPRKRPLLAAGVPASEITKVRTGYARYGSRAYPRYRYEANVGYVDAPAGREALNAEESRLKAKLAGIDLHVTYHCAD